MTVKDKHNQELKIGDKVKVLAVDSYVSKLLLTVGKIYTIKNINMYGNICFKEVDHDGFFPDFRFEKINTLSNKIKALRKLLND